MAGTDHWHHELPDISRRSKTGAFVEWASRQLGCAPDELSARGVLTGDPTGRRGKNAPKTHSKDFISIMHPPTGRVLVWIE